MQELIASDDAALAAWVWSRPAAPRTPAEEAVSRWRDLPGGLVGRHLRRQLLPELDGSEEHLRALGDLVWSEIEHGGIDEALAAILRYVDERGGIKRDAETLEDDPLRMTRKLIERVLDEANRDGLDLILASAPWAERAIPSDVSSLGTWLANTAYSWYARPDHDAAISLAALAITRAGSVDELWRRRAIEAHLIERAGRVAEAQALHEAAWSEGSRDWLAADRLSLILMRAGDPLGAAAVLEQALAHPPLREQRWTVVKPETLSKRLARCRG